MQEILVNLVYGAVFTIAVVGGLWVLKLYIQLSDLRDEVKVVTKNRDEHMAANEQLRRNAKILIQNNAILEQNNAVLEKRLKQTMWMHGEAEAASYSHLLALRRERMLRQTLTAKERPVRESIIIDMARRRRA